MFDRHTLTLDETLTKLLATVGEPVDVHLCRPIRRSRSSTSTARRIAAVMYATARAAARVRRLKSSSCAAALK
jgi:hypothetical protein